MKEERWAWLGEELGFKNCIRCRGGIYVEGVYPLSGEFKGMKRGILG
jgi:hypothetical protein